MSERQQWAEAYISLGMQPIPIPTRSKAPIIPGWQEKDFQVSDFAGEGNIGLRLGSIVDIDLDAIEARRIASHFLPPTEVKRQRNDTVTGYIYSASDVSTKKFKNPKGKMILEIRSEGCQTVFPPSIHPDGSFYGFDTTVNPETLKTYWKGLGATSEPELLKSTYRLAAASLMASSWPNAGGRHDAALRLSGLLIRTLGLTMEDATYWFTAVLIAAQDEEIDDRLRVLEDIDHRASGYGFPAFAETFGQDVASLICEWLEKGYETTKKEEEQTEGPTQRISFEEVLAKMVQEPLKIVSTGFDPLDDALEGGMEENNLVIIYGKPASGKTTFALQVAEGMYQSGAEVFLILHDESPIKVTRRLLKWYGLSYLSIRAQDMEEYERAVAKFKAFQPKIYSRTEGNTLENIVRQIEAERDPAKITVLLVDSLNVVMTDGTGTGKDLRMDTINKINVCKTMTERLNCITLLIAQQNRSGYNNSAYASIAETSQAEYTGDTLIALEKDEDTGERVLKITKERNGNAEGRKIEMELRDDRRFYPTVKEAMEDRITKFVRDNGEVTMTMIQEAFPKKKQELTTFIGRLVENGRIQVSTVGKSHKKVYLYPKQPTFQ